MEFKKLAMNEGVIISTKAEQYKIPRCMRRNDIVGCDKIVLHDYLTLIFLITENGVLGNDKIYQAHFIIRLGEKEKGKENFEFYNSFDKALQGCQEMFEEFMNNGSEEVERIQDTTHDCGIGNCFTEDVVVHIVDGINYKTKKIVDVEVGDKVRCFYMKEEYPNEKPFTPFTKEVKTVLRSKASEFIIINGDIRVTPNHRFWSVNRSEWVEAINLAMDDTLFSTDEKAVDILSLEKVVSTEPRFVYNLTIDGYPNYFVGKESGGVLVHNVKF